MPFRSRVFSVLGHFKPQSVSSLGRFDPMSFRSRVCSILGRFDINRLVLRWFRPASGSFRPRSWIISVHGRLGHESFRFRVFFAPGYFGPWFSRPRVISILFFSFLLISVYVVSDPVRFGPVLFRSQVISVTGFISPVSFRPWVFSAQGRFQCVNYFFI